MTLLLLLQFTEIQPLIELVLREDIDQVQLFMKIDSKGVLMIMQ